LLLVTLAVNALLTAAVLYLVLPDVWPACGAACVSLAIALAARIQSAKRKGFADGRTVSVGTVRTVSADVADSDAGERQIWIEVESVQGDTFIGRLVHSDEDPAVSTLRPGLVVLVAFDPAEREQLSLPDDVLAVRATGLALV
jgi:hypothetical protein